MHTHPLFGITIDGICYWSNQWSGVPIAGCARETKLPTVPKPTTRNRFPVGVLYLCKRGDKDFFTFRYRERGSLRLAETRMSVTAVTSIVSWLRITCQ
jgi:hypothetical protein